MDFVIATGKTTRDMDEATNQPYKIKALQITEENKFDLGVEILGFYYVALYKLEQSFIPKDEYFGMDLVLYSDTNVHRAEVGDWLVVSPQKYKLEIQWIGKDAFDARFEVPEPIEESKHDKPSKESNDPEVPSQVVDEIIPEINDGTV